MPIQFNADEIFTMAREIERNGAKFYRTAAKNNPAESQFLLSLAVMEDDHQATFEKMQRALSPSDGAQPHDPDGEALLYLAALADTKVFDRSRDPSALLTGTESINDILKLAIGLEKDSIIFYLGMKEVVEDSNGKEKIDLVIKEEMRHISVLGKKLSGS